MDTEVTLSKDQGAAVESVREWFRPLPRRSNTSTAQTFLLAGVAGSGKTTLVPYIVDALGLDPTTEVAYCAYTGKAAVVLKQKHGVKASTIHHLIYQPRLIEDPKTGKKVLKFFRVQFLPETLRLIVVDEASMVPNDVHRDLSSFGVPILYIGDHYQLPPVKQEDSVFALFDVNVKLDTIHRQAEKSPIIRLSAQLRDGINLTCGSYGDVYKTSNIDNLSVDSFLNADQIICGYNNTRRGMNNAFREWKGLDGLPKAQERLIILRNNYNVGLMNGQQVVLRVDASTERVSKKLLKIEYMDLWDLRDVVAMLQAEIPEGLVYRPVFEGGELPQDPKQRDKSQVLYADYAYAITCHKAQGSEWEKVLLYDDGFGRGEMRMRWLYTAVTRASSKLIWLDQS